MAVSETQLETLKQKIVSAFGDVLYPKGDIVSHECDECCEVGRIFANLDWKTIEPQFLENNYDKLPVFSPEAFHFFLPAYLIYSLEHFEEKWNEVCEFTTYALTPNKSIKENPIYWQMKFEKFTSEQFNLIYEFLEIAKSYEEFPEFLVNIEKGKERLKKFIEPILKK